MQSLLLAVYLASVAPHAFHKGSAKVSKGASNLDGVVLLAQQEDRSATKYLCEYFAPKLEAYLRKHGVRGDQVDDAVQETLMRLLIAVRRGRVVPESVEGWVITTARNVHVDTMRSEARDRRALQNAAESSSDPSAGQDELEGVETRDLVRAAVDALPEPQRAVFVLRHRGGLSYKDISSRLGITVNAVGLRLMRARRALQNVLKGRV